LALFGRRPPQRVEDIVITAAENLHTSRHEEINGLSVSASYTSLAVNVTCVSDVFKAH